VRKVTEVPELIIRYEARVKELEVEVPVDRVVPRLVEVPSTTRIPTNVKMNIYEEHILKVPHNDTLYLRENIYKAHISPAQKDEFERTSLLASEAEAKNMKLRKELDLLRTKNKKLDPNLLPRQESRQQLLNGEAVTLKEFLKEGIPLRDNLREQAIARPNINFVEVEDSEGVDEAISKLSRLEEYNKKISDFIARAEVNRQEVALQKQKEASSLQMFKDLEDEHQSTLASLRSPASRDSMLSFAGSTSGQNPYTSSSRYYYTRDQGHYYEGHQIRDNFFFDHGSRTFLGERIIGRRRM